MYNPDNPIPNIPCKWTNQMNGFADRPFWWCYTLRRHYRLFVCVFLLLFISNNRTNTLAIVHNCLCTLYGLLISPVRGSHRRAFSFAYTSRTTPFGSFVYSLYSYIIVRYSLLAQQSTRQKSRSLRHSLPVIEYRARRLRAAPVAFVVFVLFRRANNTYPRYVERQNNGSCVV